MCRLLRVCLFVLLFAAVPTVAVADWTEPAPLLVTQAGVPFRFFQPENLPRGVVQSALDDQGNALALWQRPMNLTQAGTPSGPWVFSRRRTARGEWGPLEYLHTTDTVATVGPVDMAMNGRGDAVAAWGDGWSYHLGSDALWLPSKHRDFGCLGVLDCPEGPRVSIDPAGTAIAVWAQGNAIHHATLVRAQSDWANQDAGGTLSTDLGMDPDVAVDSRHAIAAWVESVGGGNTAVRVARRAAGSGFAWADRTSISQAGVFQRPRVALSAGGIAGVTWERINNGQLEVWAAIRTADGRWRPYHLLGIAQLAFFSSEDAAAAAPAIAFDDAGNATVVYQRFRDGVGQLMWTTMPANQAGWSEPQPLGGSTLGGLFAPTISMSGDGSAIVTTAGGVYRRAGAGGWVTQPAVADMVPRAAALNAAGFAVQVAQRREPKDADENPQTSLGPGAWLQVYARLADPVVPPPPDTDGDGVIDSVDVCPAAPGPASNAGCPVTPPPPPPVTVTVGPPSHDEGTWDARRVLRGRVTVTGTATGPVTATLRIAPPRSEWGSNTATEVPVTLAGGPFTRTVQITGRYVPGDFTVSLVDANGQRLIEPQVMPWRGPARGVLVRAYFTRNVGGTPVKAPRGWSNLVANFQFATRAGLPRAKKAMRVLWNGPEGWRSGATKRPVGPLVSSGLHMEGGLQPGVWVCRLLVDGKVRAIVRVRMR